MPPVTLPIRSVLVIGAGMAGLACARALANAGLAVTILDKGRQPGGRVATRRQDGLVFNHGAQFVTSHDTNFGAFLADLRSEGRALPWSEAGGGGRRLSVVPEMAALPARLASEALAMGATIHLPRQVVYLIGTDGGWRVRHLPAAETRPGVVVNAGGEVTGTHDAVVVAIPSVQAAPLLALAAADLANLASRAAFAPCWAAMIRAPKGLAVPDVIETAAGPIAWAARETARPMVAPSRIPFDTWTLHASPDWSRRHFDDLTGDVGREMVAAFAGHTGATDCDLVFAHRWRFARVEKPVGQPHLWNALARVGACGDWCIGGRVEAAFESGHSLASAILAEAGRLEG